VRVPTPEVLCVRQHWRILRVLQQSGTKIFVIPGFGPFLRATVTTLRKRTIFDLSMTSNPSVQTPSIAAVVVPMRP